jgi:hypothetical protein
VTLPLSRAVRGGGEIVLHIKILKNILIVFLMIFLLSGCNPVMYEYMHDLTVENKTNQTIQIYVKPADSTDDPIYIGEVRSMKTKKFYKSDIVPLRYKEHLIKVRDSIDDKLISSKVYTNDELIALDWKITVN